MEPESGTPQADAIPWQARRLTWFMIFGSLSAAVIVYRVVIGFVTRPVPVPASPSPIRIALYIAAPLALLLSIAWARRQLDPPADASPIGSPEPAPGRFTAMSVVAMALAEFSAISGFVLYMAGAGTAAEYLAFGAGTFLVMTLVILPRGLRYWAAWQSYAESRPGPTA